MADRGERFTGRTQVGVQNLGAGASSGLMQLAGKFQQFSEQAGAARRSRVTEESFRAGQVSLEEGKKPEFKEERFIGGVSSKAFNSGLRNAYLAGVANDARENLNRIESDNPTDVQAYGESAAAYMNAVLSEADPIALPLVQQGLEKSISQGRVRVQNAGFKAQAESAKIASDQAWSGFANDAARFARNGEVESSSDAFSSMQEITLGQVESGQISREAGEKRIRETRQEIREQELRRAIIGVIDTAGLDAASEQLESMADKVPKGWEPDDWDAFIKGQRAEISRQAARAKGALTESNKEAKNALKDFETALSLGFEVSAEEKRRVSSLVAGTDLKESFDRANNVAAFSVLSQEARDLIINSARTGDLADVKDFEAMFKADEEITKLAAKDGYSLGVKQRLVEESPFDPFNPEFMAERARQASMLTDHYGVDVSPFTDKEATGISESLVDMPIKDKVRLALSLSDAPGAWGQIAEKNQKAFAIAGASGDVDLMAAVFKGQELLAAKLVTPAPAKEYLPVLNTYTADVYGIQDRESVLEAAKAHYAATADDGGEFDPSLFEDSLAAVTGGIADVNGFRLALPRGTSEDDFDDFIDAFTPKQVEELGGVLSFTNEEAAEKIHSSRIKSVGDNQYIVMTGEGSALFKKDGSPLIISWSIEADAEMKANKFFQKKRILEIEAAVRQGRF